MTRIASKAFWQDCADLIRRRARQKGPRTANLLIRERGDRTTVEAAQRADAMLVKGDLDGNVLWLRA